LSDRGDSNSIQEVQHVLALTLEVRKESRIPAKKRNQRFDIHDISGVVFFILSTQVKRFVLCEGFNIRRLSVSIDMQVAFASLFHKWLMMIRPLNYVQRS
jgi:hypothetical protein